MAIDVASVRNKRIAMEKTYTGGSEVRGRMSIISFAELKSTLLMSPLETIVHEHILGGMPFVFRDAPHDYEILRSDLANSLSLDVQRFTIVGSAKCGFSLSPDSFGREFRDESDVDVVVVDADRFDRMWHALVDWDYQLGFQEGWRKQWRAARRQDVYWGWFLDRPLWQRREEGLPLASGLRALRDISNEWFNAFQSIGLRHPRLSGRRFSGRLYRTWQHAVSYHANNLRELRQSLQTSTEQP